MLKNPRVVLLIALLVISVATLVQTIVDEDNRLVYGIATTIAHVALVVVGTTFVRGSLAKRTPPTNP